MNSYVIPIQYAFIIFPLIAFLFTIPYMIYIYRKYGSISPLRTLIVYSFILYLISAYFLVILPLPKISEVAKYTTPRTQLIPFHFITDIIENSTLVLSDITTYIPAIKESYIYNVGFNLLLFIPFGIYLRYYFKCSYKKTLFISFLLSLFFELTQLSGLYFIYPRPYRLFDVDDLIINTLGGSFGYLLTPLVSLVLPSRDKIDETSYKRGTRVSYIRRLIALMIDFLIINIIVVFISIFNSSNYTYISTVLLYFIINALVTKGSTIGKLIIKIKIVDKEGNTPKFYQYIIRYILLYGLLFLPVIQIYILTLSTGILNLLLFLTAGIIYIVFILKMFIDIIRKKEQLFYEKISNTKHISTIENINNIEEMEDDKNENSAN